MRSLRNDGLLRKPLHPSWLLLLFLPLFVAGQSARAQSRGGKQPAEIAREQSRAVVVIEALDHEGRLMGQGSGFLVTPSGAIVTNLHVIRSAARVRVKLPEGDVYQTEDLIDFDLDKDLAILKIKGFNLPTVRLGDSDRTEVGEAVVVISSPEGLTNSLTTGVISGVRRLETHRVFQITAPISQGSSGGALFDSSGAVIGVTTYILRSGQNINFAVPINYARGMISDQPRATLASIPPAAPSTTQPATSSIAGNEIEETPDDHVLSGVSTATRSRLGRVSHEPMFARPDEAISFFYRLVDGIGLYRLPEVAELARTAALVKTGETEKTEEYTIRYLSFYTGAAFTFRKSDQMLEFVDMLVTWSVADFARNYGDKYKRRTIDGRKVLEIKKTEEGRQVQAFLDDNGNVRVVRFTKPKS